MGLLTKAGRKVVLDATMANISWEYSDKLDLSGIIRLIQGGNRQTIKPPGVTFLFLPIERPNFKSLDMVVANGDTKYPTWGFAQEELVEMRTFTETMRGTDLVPIHGGLISEFITNQIIAYMAQKWDLLLEPFGAGILLSTVKTVDETEFIEGSNLFSWATRFTIVSTAGFRYIPPGAIMTKDPIRKIDSSIDDDEGEHPVMISNEA